MKYFGTDGIRGIINDDLNTDLLIRIGRAINSLNVKNIYIGYDTRESKDLVLYSLVSGLLSKGINVIDVGVVSTPALQYYSLIKKKTVLMITASHNPYFYNGIKIFIDGQKLNEDQEEMIEYSINNDDLINGVGRYSKTNEVIELYLEFLRGLIVESKYKINLDVANGALVNIVNQLFLGNKNITISNNVPNGININDKCGSLFIKETPLNDNDFLFAFDGDGDRILFKDNNKIYDGDLVVYLLAKYYKSKKEEIKSVVLTKNANLGVIKALEKLKVKVFLSDIGDKNVYDLMIKEGSRIGGESSGHIIDLNYMISGDGLLNFMILNKIISEIDVNEYLKEVEYYPFKNIDLNVDYPMDILKEIENKYKKKARINIRRSGTERKIRVNICSKKEKNIIDIVKEIRKYEECED